MLKLIGTVENDGVKTETYMMDYYKVKAVYHNSTRDFTIESKLFSRFDRRYLPEIVYDSGKFGKEEAFRISTISHGLLGEQELEKVMSGYEIALVTVRELNGKFITGGKTMKLYDWMSSNLDDDDMVTVVDKDYDMEAYFCTFGPDSEPDDFDLAMEKLSMVLDVVDVKRDAVTVNLGELIERNYERVKWLFQGANVADIAESMTSILAGYCSGKWLSKFADALAA